MTAARELRKVEPGIYRRATVDYDSIDAVRFSNLKVMARSPRHYRHVVESGVEQTTPMRLGLAAHTAVLEPSRFTMDYAVIADKDDGKAPRRGTKAWDAFVAENAGRTVLKQAEFDAALRVRDAVRSDPLAMRYLRRGQPEAAVVWRDERTGVLCKCRLDWLSESVPDVIAELKTAADVSPLRFQAAYARLLYHGQAAFQVDGLRTILGRDVYHKCIAVESKEPHDVVIYDVIGEPLEAGRELYAELLDALVACERDREWPGHGRGAEVSLRLPAWAVANDEDLSDLGLDLGELGTGDGEE